MGLLQPWLLALGLGVAVPLLLHLFQRHQGPRVIFPALRYLRRAEKESARRVKLRQWLLMLLRMAVVLAVALAAARPFLLGAGAAHEPTAVVIVLDNSMSSGAVIGERRVLDELRERALATLSNAGPDDRFWLLRAGSPHEPALAGDAFTTAQRVRETEPTAAAADLRTALTRARAILSTGAEGRAPEIQLLSDLQSTELRDVRAEGGTPPLVAYAPAYQPPVNRAVVDVSVAGGMAPLAGVRTQIAARLAGSAGDSVNVRLFAGERLVAATGARAGGAVVLPLPAREPGLLPGRVESDADALHADDVRFFVTRVLPPPAVAAPAASSFLREALTVMEEAGRLRPSAPQLADVVLVSGSASLPQPRTGGTLVIVPPTSPVELPALNRQLVAAGIPWSYAPAAEGGAAQLAIADSADPLLRALQQVRLARNYALRNTQRTASDSTLLRTRSGGAWAVRGELRGGGRYILLGSPLDADATSIPLSAAMIPLLDRIIGTWAAGSAERLEAYPGQVLALPRTATHVRRPDGSEEPAAGGSHTVAALAGIHEVLAGDSVLTAFAVNPPAGESELGRVRAGQLDEIFAGWDVTAPADAEAWERAAFRARLGLELWRPLLFALLALLALEALIAATGARRPKPTHDAAVEAA